MNSTKPLIVANWKCNPTSQKEARHLFEAVKNGIKGIKKAETVFCPPFTWLAYLSSFLNKQKKSNWRLGAQDCHWQEKGAFTGAVSPLMLKDLGAEYVLIGHSERRRYFNESDEIINQKLAAALRARLKPILCVGEENRDENGSTQPLNELGLMVSQQLRADLIGISASQLNEIVIAYEPVWAIGTGNFCPADEAMKAGLLIRKTITKLYSRHMAERVKILYGGSVNSKIAADYIFKARMDGLLVGGASLNVSEFVRIVKKATEIK